MVISLDIIISSIISLIAVMVAILSFLEVKRQTKQSREQSEKQTKLLETISEALPYTIKGKKAKSNPDKKLSKDTALSKGRADDIKRMKLELEKEKLQWQKNKDIAKGLAWIIDRLDSDDEDEDDNNF
jgi:biopolymer transport protein ExbB/TolQ